MKVLILSCNTGQGHDSAAKAVEEKLTMLGHECVMKDTLSYASKYYSAAISKSYDKIVLHIPKAFGIGYRFCKSRIYKPGKLKSIPYVSNMMCCKKLYSDIQFLGIDAVICTHVFAGQAMTHIKHKYNLQIPLYMISTDYSFCPYYDELDAEKYFIAVKEISNEYTERRIPRDKIVASGIPVSGKFALDISQESARQKLGLPEDKKICLIMSGSMGYGDIYQLIDDILDYNIDNIHIIVITGRNKKLYNGICDTYGADTKVSAVGFTDKVYLYMKASNVVVTKPGGLSSTESMVSNVPLVLTNPIPGCETENFDLLTSLGVAAQGKENKTAAKNVFRILTDDNVSDKMIQMQNNYINKNASEIICDNVVRRKVLENEFVS